MPERHKLSVLESLQQPGDVLPGKVAEDDIAILVVGPPAVGKSTFINNILQKANSNETARVGNGYTSCTDRLAQYSVKLPDCPTNGDIVLVDTPSFDRGGSADDAFESLRQIAVWLASLHTTRLRICAIVFMYPIHRPGRLTTMDIASFRVFCELLGARNLPRIISVTNQWDLCDRKKLDDMRQRERDIWSEFWKGTWDRNDSVPVYRLFNTDESAFKVLRLVVARSKELGTPTEPLIIQKEIIMEGKAFRDTVAHRVLTSVLVKQTEYPRRYSISQLLRFRQTIEISSMTDYHFGPIASSHSDVELETLPNANAPNNDDRSNLATPNLDDFEDEGFVVLECKRSPSLSSSSTTSALQHGSDTSSIVFGEAPSNQPQGEQERGHDQRHSYLPNANGFTIQQLNLQSIHANIQNEARLIINNNTTNITHIHFYPSPELSRSRGSSRHATF